MRTGQNWTLHLTLWFKIWGVVAFEVVLLAFQAWMEWFDVQPLTGHEIWSIGRERGATTFCTDRCPWREGHECRLSVQGLCTVGLLRQEECYQVCRGSIKSPHSMTLPIVAKSTSVFVSCFELRQCCIYYGWDEMCNESFSCLNVLWGNASCIRRGSPLTRYESSIRM